MMQPDQQTATAPHTLKLFGAPLITAAATLRQAFQAYVLPELDDRTPATLMEYSGLLTHWEKLTTNPSLSAIGRETVKAFRKSLVETPYKRGKKKRPRSAATVNKIMRTLSATITPLWPADRHNPGGAGLLPFFAFPRTLAEQAELPFVFSRADMSRLYLACGACKATGGYRQTTLYNPHAWRTAIVLALNAGPRTWDLFALKWADIRWDDFKHGSVRFTATKTQKLQRVPLNRVTAIHLRHLQSLQLDPERVFPRFEKNKSFYAAWGRICAKAGVNAPFESFRKTCSTLADDVIPGVGAWICGHSLGGVNAKNYQNPTRRVFRAVYGLKQPVEFARGAKALQGTSA